MPERRQVHEEGLRNARRLILRKDPPHVAMIEVASPGDEHVAIRGDARSQRLFGVRPEIRADDVQRAAESPWKTRDDLARNAASTRHATYIYALRVEGFGALDELESRDGGENALRAWMFIPEIVRCDPDEILAVELRRPVFGKLAGIDGLHEHQHSARGSVLRYAHLE